MDNNQTSKLPLDLGGFSTCTRLNQQPNQALTKSWQPKILWLDIKIWLLFIKDEKIIKLFFQYLMTVLTNENPQMHEIILQRTSHRKHAHPKRRINRT